MNFTYARAVWSYVGRFFHFNLDFLGIMVDFVLCCMNLNWSTQVKNMLHATVFMQYGFYGLGLIMVI